MGYFKGALLFTLLTIRNRFSLFYFFKLDNIMAYLKGTINMNKITAISLGFCIFSLNFNASANDTFGALRANAQAPFHANSLTPSLRSGMQNPSNEVYTSLSLGSIWIESENYAMDYYQNQFNLGSEFRVNERLKVDLKYTYIFAKDNNLDSLTYDFHDWVGMSQNGRDEVEYNEYNIHTPYGDSNNFEGNTLGNAFTVYFDYALLQRGGHGVTLGTSLYLNTGGDGDFNQTTFDQSVQINYGYVGKYNQFYTTVGFSHNSDAFLSYVDEGDYKNFRLMFGFGYNHMIVQNHSFILEGSIFEGAIEEEVESSDQFSEASFEVRAGYRWLISNNAAFEFIFNENLVNMDNSLDIGFDAGLRYQF